MAAVTDDNPRRGLRIVFMCQAVDEDDPVLPTTVRWIDALARKPGVEAVRVLALRSGRYDLPDNVEVTPFQRSNRFTSTFSFYSALRRSLRPRPDVFFVYQGGPYPAMLLPVKLPLRIPIVQWKAHPVISRKMAFYARRCDDLILTSARAAFPMDLAKVHVIGQGVDTERFQIAPVERLGDLIAVGRITPTKHVEEMIRAVVHANHTNQTTYRFNIYGPTLPGQEAYEGRMLSLIDELGASDWVALKGPVRQEELPALLNAHRASLNFTYGAIDKTAVEAMACGLPVITNNDAITEIIPLDLQGTLVTDKDDVEAQAAAIHVLLSRPDAEIAQLGQRLRALVVSDHSTERLFDRIVAEIEALPGVRP
jgi:glycosyltransferase involved in cell wall biosynthesis